MKLSVIRTTSPTSNATVDYTVAGFGTPTAALFFGCSATVDDTTASAVHTTMGATDGTRQWVNFGQCLDGTGTSNGRNKGQDGSPNFSVYRLMTSSSTDSVAVSAEFNSWITNGVRLDWSQTGREAGMIIVLIQCTSAYASHVDVSGGGLIDITAPGFRPQHVICSTEFQAAAGHFESYRGFAHDDGAGNVTQGCALQTFFHNLSTTETEQVIYNDRVLDRQSGGQPSSLQDFDANGFSVNASSTVNTTELRYLALRDNETSEGGVQVFGIGSSTGIVDYTGYGTRAKYVLMIPTSVDAEGVNYSDNRANVQSFAILNSDNGNDSFLTQYAEDNVSTSDCSMRYGAGVKSFDRTNDAAYSLSGTFDSGIGDGFRLNVSAANDRQALALVMGEPGGHNLMPFFGAMQ